MVRKVDEASLVELVKVRKEIAVLEVELVERFLMGSLKRTGALIFHLCSNLCFYPYCSISEYQKHGHHIWMQ